MDLHGLPVLRGFVFRVFLKFGAVHEISLHDALPDVSIRVIFVYA